MEHFKSLLDNTTIFDKYEGENLFIAGLLGMEERFRFYYGLSKRNDQDYYYPTKQYIFMPFTTDNDFVASAAHEIAHMVEMQNYKRCLLPDWGMHAGPKKNTPSEYFAMLARETRVRAIEMIIAPFSCEKEKQSSTRYDIFNNPYFGSELKKMIPFGRFKNAQEVKDWTYALRDRTLRDWSRERIFEEWKNKLDYIRDWMETSEDKQVAA